MPFWALSQIFPELRPDFFTGFQHFSTDEGLSDNRVRDIIQDDKGYIWIATENGLNKFDGYHFKNYFTGDFISVPSNTILDLEIDIAGNLWVATDKGLCYYNRETDQFYTVKQNESDSLRFPDRHIRKLLADNEGNLWIETKEGYLIQLQVFSEEFQSWKHKGISQEYYRYHALFMDKKKNIWCGGRNSGPYFFDRAKAQFELLPVDNVDPGKKRESDTGEIFEDSFGNFWITGLDGIYLYNRENRTFSKQLGVSTYQIIEDRKKRLWFATGNGLLRFDAGKNELLHFLHNPDISKSLGNNVVNCLYEDRWGNIWIGTGDGLNLFPAKSEKLLHLTHIAGVDNSLASNDITCAMQLNDGEIWIGTREHGISRLNIETLSIRNLTSAGLNENGMSSNNISCLYQTKNDDIWIGLWSGLGFNRFNKNTGKFDRIAQLKDSRLQDWYNDFLEDSHGNFWVGSWGGNGLMRCDQTDLTLFPDRKENVLKSLPSRLITCLAECPDGNLIVGTFDKGFAIFNYEKNEAESFSDAFPEPEVLWGNKINALHRDNNGFLWIAAKGLNRFDLSTKTFKHFFAENQFANLEIYSILSNQHDQLWLGTNQGIIVLNTKTEMAFRLNTSNILPFNQFSKAACKLENGHFLFGGKRGVVIFHPDSMVITGENRKVHLTQINHINFPVYHDATLFNRFEFSPKQKYLSFHFSTLADFGITDLVYEYQITGYHTQWLETQKNQNIVAVSNLPPGNFELFVRLKGRPETVSSWPLFMKPAVWETFWFRLLIFCFILTLISVYIWLRHRKLVAEKNALALNQKFLRAQMNPHFIFNSLNSIQHYILHNKPALAGLYLGKFSKLVRGILYNSREDLIPLDREMEFIGDYLEMQKMRFEDKFDYRIEVDKDLPTDLVKIPPMLSQPFIENAIIHGFKDEKEGLLRISVTKQNHFVQFEIEDNGVGIYTVKNFDSTQEAHQSLATKITSDRLRLLFPGKAKECKFDILDLSGSGGKGTRVTILIPLIYD